MDFPRTVDEITPEWLTNVLRESGAIDKSTVESVSANVLDGGATSEVQKLVIEYDLDAEQAPKSIIAKIAHQDPETRSLVDDLSLYETEILFYQHFNKGVGITVPDIYFSSYDHATKEMLLLQEDLSDLRSIPPGIECNFDDAVNAFDAAVGFHAKWWDNESLFDIPWLIDYSDEEYAQIFLGSLHRISIASSRKQVATCPREWSRLFEIWHPDTPRLFRIQEPDP